LPWYCFITLAPDETIPNAALIHCHILTLEKESIAGNSRNILWHGHLEPGKVILDASQVLHQLDLLLFTGRQRLLDIVQLSPGIEVIKLFSFVTDTPNKQAKIFVPDKSFEPSLLFDSKARTYTSGAPIKSLL
jgi:hypothetical protein